MCSNSLKQLEKTYKVKMKRLIKISICLIIVSMVIFFGIKRERREYEEKIVYTKAGIPVWLVDCGDIRVLYHYVDESTASYFCYAQTTDSSYIFGEKGIQVGMDRDAVEKILENSKKPTPDPDPRLIIGDMGETSYQDVFAYFDDIYDYGLGFIYDDDNKVSHILLFFGL